MCGIFGMVLQPGHGWRAGDLGRAVRRLWRLSESRGREAAGLAVACGGEIRLLRAPRSASALIRGGADRDLWRRAAPKLARGRSLTVIGHSRLVTDGHESRDANNQPLVTGRVVGVHNGIVVNHESLWRDNPGLHRRGEVDSEVLFRLLDRFLGRGVALAEALCRVFRDIEGTASVAAVFTDRAPLLLATNNGSLYHGRSGPVAAFGSEAHILRCFARRGLPPALQSGWGMAPVGAGRGLWIDPATLTATSFALVSGAPVASEPSIRHRPRHLRRTGPVPAPSVAMAARSGPPGRFRRGGAVPAYPARVPAAAGILRRCTRCILPETMPFIAFDAHGVCNFCRHHRPLKHHGREALLRAVAPYRRLDGRPDCLVGISGGRDSCHALHVVKTELGMNPVAFTYDWGMVTDLARRNIARLCGRLGVEHILVSADIRRKRAHIRRNVASWLRRPRLGMVPLFMAGDKAYFRVARKLRRQVGVELVILGENMLERTDFKTGFAGVPPSLDPDHVYTLPAVGMLRLAVYYAGEYLANPGYLNRSLVDTAAAFAWYYLLDRDYLNLYRYLPWDEGQIVGTLRAAYDWEAADDTDSTWRIGDGTAAFYNCIYLTAAGFTENDTFRSNQVREGMVSRAEALRLAERDNRPRLDSIRWYLDTIGLPVPLAEVLAAIRSMPERRRLLAGDATRRATKERQTP